jgi:putative membrane protein
MFARPLPVSHGSASRVNVRPLAAVRLATLVAAAALGAGCQSDDREYGGSTRDSNTQGQTQTRDTSSARFVQEAGSGGMMEVQLGRLATERAQDERVGQFGQRMVQDHTQANNDLMQAASRMNMVTPTAMMPMHQEHYDRLSRLSGRDFHRAYIRMIVDDHAQDVRNFEQQARSGDDADVRDFANRTLPTLREHLQMVRDIARDMGI